MESDQQELKQNIYLDRWELKNVFLYGNSKTKKILYEYAERVLRKESYNLLVEYFGGPNGKKTSFDKLGKKHNLSGTRMSDIIIHRILKAMSLRPLPYNIFLGVCTEELKEEILYEEESGIQIDPEKILNSNNVELKKSFYLLIQTLFPEQTSNILNSYYGLDNNEKKTKEEILKFYNISLENFEQIIKDAIHNLQPTQLPLNEIYKINYYSKLFRAMDMLSECTEFFNLTEIDKYLIEYLG